MEDGNSTASREKNMGIVGEEGLKGERKGLGDWGGLADIDVSKEAET